MVQTKTDWRELPAELEAVVKATPPAVAPKPTSRLARGAAAQAYLRDSLSNKLAKLTEDYIAKPPDFSTGVQYSKAFTTDLRQHMLASYLAGLRAQGLDVSRGMDLNPAQSKEFLKLYDEQFRYFQRFHLDMMAKQKKGVELGPREVARSKMYAGGTTNAFNSAKMTALVDQPDVSIDWMLSPAENCPDCIDLANGGPYSLDELDQVPGDGSTVCLTNCKCYLAFRKVSKQKFNPNHDNLGRFASGDGGASETSQSVITGGGNSLVGRSPAEIKGILNFERIGGSTPELQDLVHTNHAKLIAELASEENISPDQYVAQENAKLAELMTLSHVYIRVPDATVLDSILNDGYVQNQFESGESSGMFSPSTRKDVELDVLGVERTASPRERPVYGYLTFNENGNDRTDPYGQVVIKLKDEAKNRTAFVYGDSLDDIHTELAKLHTEHPPEMYPSPITHPSINSIELTRMRAKDPVELAKHTNFFRYVETQIYGGVHLSDIAEVRFDGLRPKMDGSSPIPKDLRTKLDKAGIKYTIVNPQYDK